MNKKGFFIVLEGIDGSGKNTILKNLVKQIDEKEKGKKNSIFNFLDKIDTTFEPTAHTVSSKEIKKYLAGNKKVKDNHVLLNLFIQDRLEHSSQIIQKLLSHHVFCTRYDLSTYAYQSQWLSYREDFEEIYRRHQYQTKLDLVSGEKKGSLIPDLTFFLKLDLGVALARIIQRKKKIELYEKKDLLTKISDLYDKAINFLIQKDKRKIKVIDATKSIEEIVELMLQSFQELK